MLVMGEVNTGLLQHSTSISAAEAARILTLRIGDNVRSFARPISHVVSPDLFTGLDCKVGGGDGARMRGVGTACSRVSITGGQIVQASTTVVLQQGATAYRMPWSYYLARPGVMEALGRSRWPEVATGWLLNEGGAPNLGAISARLLDDVQGSPLLRRPAALRAARGRLRWVMDASSGAPPGIEVSLEAGDLQTVRVTGAPAEPAAIAEFCADLALHDWLLSTLLVSIERSGLESGAGTAALVKLRPVIENLLHLWMPAARSHLSLLPYWASLERAPGLDRQWNAQVNRIRDQMAIAAIDVPGAVSVERGDVG
jgi:hypothetical protein